MRSRPYLLIAGLLLLCLVSVLALQAYWLGNFYSQKKEQFAMQVYASLNQVSARLHEREQVDRLKGMKLVVQAGDSALTRSGKKPRKMGVRVNKSPRERRSPMQQAGITKHMVLADSSVVLINESDEVHVVSGAAGEFPRYNGVDPWAFGQSAEHGSTKNKAAREVIVRRHDSLLTISQRTESPGRDVEVRTLKLTTEGGTGEMQKLVDKMMAELRSEHTFSHQPDSLEGLIRKTLSEHGIFGPFRFSLRRMRNDSSMVIAQSKDFMENLNYYKADLSAQKVFPNHLFLFLQFPGERGAMISSMKGSLLVSLLFSIVLAGAFSYSLRLIFTQKKVAEVKADFVNNMTHELKTPIATISLAVDSINNPAIRNDPARFGEYSRILKEENNRLNGHVERVLQMSMLEKGALALKSEPVDLCRLAEDTVKDFSLRIAEKQADVKVTLASSPALVSGDEAHLRAVFSNLIDNALKYSGQAPGIGVSVRRENGSVMASVSDNGIGIPASHRGKVFEKFYRVQKGDLHDVKGFGLGLSYVRSVIEAHGGSVALTSEPAKGTTVTMTMKAYA